MKIGNPDSEALKLGAFQSVLLGVALKYFGALVLFGLATPFLAGLGLVGFALGARAAHRPNHDAAQKRFLFSFAALVFLLMSRLYYVNPFRMYFYNEKPVARFALLLVCVWLLCYAFSYLGRRYACVLRGAASPVRNYALLASGFAAGTAVFGLLAGLQFGRFSMADALAVALLAAVPLLVEIPRAKIIAAVSVLTCIAGYVFVKPAQFSRIAFTWGVTKYEHAADVWSPYYKIDIITFKNNTVLCGLYNYTGMLIAPKHFEDLERAAGENEGLYAAAMPPGAQSALIMGSGGGMKHPALFNKTMKRITAVEIDPAIVRLMRDRFGEFNRGFYSDARVRPVVAEGRAFLNSNKEKFDYIEYESLDTGLYATAMNTVPVEKRLYTSEGLSAAVAHLSDGGLMRISIGTDEDKKMVRPLVSSLPENVYYDVYRVYLNIGKIVGIEKESSGGLAGWAGRMPHTAILVAKKKHSIERARAWYEKLDKKSLKNVKRLDIPRDPRARVTDNRPFFGGPSRGAPAPSFVFLILIALAPAILFARKNPNGFMHYYFYAIGAGYVCLEILFLALGVRGSTNPALTGLLLLTAFTAGNAAACALVSRLDAGRAGVAAAAALLITTALAAPALTATPAIAVVSSLVAGALGGLFWPVALQHLRCETRAGALASDALGALPGAILFNAAVFLSGFHAAAVATSILYASAAFLFLIFNKPAMK